MEEAHESDQSAIESLIGVEEESTGEIVGELADKLGRAIALGVGISTIAYAGFCYAPKIIDYFSR